MRKKMQRLALLGTVLGGCWRRDCRPRRGGGHDADLRGRGVRSTGRARTRPRGSTTIRGWP